MRAARARTLVARAVVLVALALPACGGDEPEFPELAPPSWPERIESPAVTPRPDRPNLILVSLDTLRADRLSAYGHDRPTSPSFDRLAAESTLFENAFSHSPKTAPSHMSLMTGLYPEAHGVRNRFAGAETWSGRLSVEIPTLAQILSNAGYRTVARTGGGNIQGDLGFDQGFESYESPVLTADALFRAAFSEAERLAAGAAPYFLFVHTYAIHSPYLPPASERARFVDPEYRGEIVSDGDTLVGDTLRYGDLHREFWRRVDRDSPADRRHLLDLYDANIRYVDSQLGAFVDDLARLADADRTLLVVTSDHGEEFGEHGGFEHGALWRELLHVPLLIRVPEALRPGWVGRRIEPAVGLVDVLPTLLELTSLPVPTHLQGQSLVALVERGAAPRPWTFAQFRYAGEVALSVGRWKLLRDAEGERLFDLAEDPRETTDAAALREDVRSRAAEQVDRVLAASRAYRSLAPVAGPVALDAEARERLEALGYVDSGDPATP